MGAATGTLGLWTNGARRTLGVFGRIGDNTMSSGRPSPLKVSTRVFPIVYSSFFLLLGMLITGEGHEGWSGFQKSVRRC